MSPRPVIPIIGDGLDDQQITIARNCLEIAAGPNCSLSCATPWAVNGDVAPPC